MEKSKIEIEVCTAAAAASAHARVAILKKLLCQTCRVAVERKHCVSKHQRRDGGDEGDAHNENSSIAKALENGEERCPDSGWMGGWTPGTRSCWTMLLHSITWREGTTMSC